jgi:hypothetical protein
MLVVVVAVLRWMSAWGDDLSASRLRGVMFGGYCNRCGRRGLSRVRDRVQRPVDRTLDGAIVVLVIIVVIHAVDEIVHVFDELDDISSSLDVEICGSCCRLFGNCWM